MSETWELFALSPLTLNQEKKTKKKACIESWLSTVQLESEQWTVHSPHQTQLGPERPSPYDCTNSVSDELVLIQLLNLVQSEVESHFVFWHTLQENFFSPVDLPCSPNYLVQKKIPTCPAPLSMLWFFFSKLSFFLSSLSLLLLQIEKTMPSLIVAVDVLRRTRSCCNFKVWATQGATSSRRHENKEHLVHFFFCT